MLKLYLRAGLSNCSRHLVEILTVEDEKEIRDIFSIKFITSANHNSSSGKVFPGIPKIRFPRKSFLHLLSAVTLHASSKFDHLTLFTSSYTVLY